MVVGFVVLVVGLIAFGTWAWSGRVHVDDVAAYETLVQQVEQLDRTMTPLGHSEIPPCRDATDGTVTRGYPQSTGPQAAELVGYLEQTGWVRQGSDPPRLCAPDADGRGPPAHDRRAGPERHLARGVPDGPQCRQPLRLPPPLSPSGRSVPPLVGGHGGRVTDGTGHMVGMARPTAYANGTLVHMRAVTQSKKLQNVCYEIRGPVLAEAKRLEDEGHRILKLNIGNPAPFGFEAPEDILVDVIQELPTAQGYSDSKGILSARRAVKQHYELRDFPAVGVEDIYLGNGVSELIVMAMQGLLDNGDEVLIPAPDYPLWTAAASLAGGNAVHYVCDEQAGWAPDIDDIRSKVTDRTRAIVVINPNNPTGAVYPREVLEAIAQVAREHELIVMADEIYDKILYEDATHTSIASLAPDLLCLTFNGLSKAYRVAGFRSGWLAITGPKEHARNYLEGLDILANMRLCANVPAQHAIQVALGGYQSINELILPGGRLLEQRNVAWEMLNAIPGVSVTKPEGALYLFPRLDPKVYDIRDDQRFALDLLREQKLLVVHGTGFNWATHDHFRIVFLPRVEDLEDAMGRLEKFLSTYSQ